MATKLDNVQLGTQMYEQYKVVKGDRLLEIARAYLKAHGTLNPKDPQTLAQANKYKRYNKNKTDAIAIENISAITLNEVLLLPYTADVIISNPKDVSSNLANLTITATKGLNVRVGHGTTETFLFTAPKGSPFTYHKDTVFDDGSYTWVAIDIDHSGYKMGWIAARIGKDFWTSPKIDKAVPPGGLG